MQNALEVVAAEPFAGTIAGYTFSWCVIGEHTYGKAAGKDEAVLWRLSRFACGAVLTHGKPTRAV